MKRTMRDELAALPTEEVKENLGAFIVFIDLTINSYKLF